MGSGGMFSAVGQRQRGEKMREIKIARLRVSQHLAQSFYMHVTSNLRSMILLLVSYSLGPIKEMKAC